MAKRFVTMVVILITTCVLLPTGTALAGGLPTNPIITMDRCVLTIEFDAQAPGLYTVNIWDAGKIIQSKSGAGAFFGDTLVFEFLIVKYETRSAQGIYAEIMKGTEQLWGSQIGSIESICESSLDNGCQPKLTENAVVGHINENTLAYWAPSYNAPTDTILEIGKTWWVLGVDSTGAWYQIIVSCQPVWVPGSVLGPNFDEVWNGQSLPTDRAR